MTQRDLRFHNRTESRCEGRKKKMQADSKVPMKTRLRASSRKDKKNDSEWRRDIEIEKYDFPEHRYLLGLYSVKHLSLEMTTFTCRK